ncbi:MAG: rubrerythrin [Methanomicrobiales archaeon]
MKKTIENLTKAFIGESQARNRYTMYSKIAKKEGYVQLSEIFLETADNEREHAKWLFRLINQLKEETDEDLEELTVEALAPTTLGNTVENLKSAIAGEYYENTEMYPDFADVAQSEGYDDIAERLRSIAQAEVHHEDRYRKILKEVEAGTVFKKDKPVKWACIKCGYTRIGEEPPEECPSCDHPAKYFKIINEEF